MGTLLLIGRLAVRDLRRRRLEAALMLAVIAAATAALSLGLALTGVTARPYLDTRALTNGPDVTAQSDGAARGGAAPASLTALEHAPGVTGFSGPYPMVSPVLRAHGATIGDGFAAEGRSAARAAIDQPKVIQGTWVRPGGIVAEPTYAAEAGLAVGDRVTLDGRPFRVVGLAVTAAWPSVNAPGLLWLTTADARSLAAAPGSLSYTLNLRLARPAAAPAFADAPSREDLGLSAWQQISSHDGRGIQIEQTALAVGSTLLCLLAAASVAVLVGGRMAEQTRRVGLLKAVGGTPGLIAAVLLAEQLAVALLAGAAGLAAGWLAAPLLARPADGLLGTPGAPVLTAGMAGLVVGAALAVAAAATVVPAIRAARTSTVAALADAARPPRRRRWLVAMSRRLPVPLLLGLRLAARRPRRLVLSAASVTVTVATVVAVLNMHDRSRVHRVPGGLINPVATQVDRVLTVITIVLIILAAISAVFVTWATVQDARHPLAVARSLGATREQVSAGVSAAQLVSALPGALLGIPAGLGLIAAASHGGPSHYITPAQLAAVFAGALIVVVALAAIPARIAARHPVAEILQAETA
jgi:putative ABC transport system permease protein